MISFSRKGYYSKCFSNEGLNGINKTHSMPLKMYDIAFDENIINNAIFQ